MEGKLIVIEGIDGAGTETQSNLLQGYLKKKGIPAERLTYPDYSHPTGKIIHEYLHKKFELPNEVLVLLHLADRAKDAKKIKRWLEDGRIVIADRYATSAMAYQGFAGFPVEKIIQIAEMVGIPRPDFIVYLNVSAETSMQRKLKEKPELDRNEENKELMKSMGEFYLELAEKNTFGKWFVVDGEKPKQEVFELVRNAAGL